jgi:dihydroorotate dehydrogenase
MMATLTTDVLRLLPPEDAHRATIAALVAGLGPRAPKPAARLATRLAGLDLPSPVGLAAGFDKNAQVPDAMLRAGFGWVECGTVTPRPQEGNPRPRIFRLPADRAVINRLGFNNRGLMRFVARLRARGAAPGIVGANIGANKDAADRDADYVECLGAVWPWCRYVTVNISSPNTPGLRGLQARDALERLLAAIALRRGSLELEHGLKRPVFLKLAPDLDDAAAVEAGEVAIAHGIDALVISNTTLARPPTLRAPARHEAGGLSGAPLFAPSTALLATVYRALGSRIALVGVGGIASAQDAWDKIRAGASAVQLYTALVYEGPDLVTRINAGLAARMEAEGFATLSQAVGSAAGRQAP